MVRISYGCICQMVRISYRCIWSVSLLSRKQLLPLNLEILFNIFTSPKMYVISSNDLASWILSTFTTQQILEHKLQTYQQALPSSVVLTANIQNHYMPLKQCVILQLAFCCHFYPHFYLHFYLHSHWRFNIFGNYLKSSFIKLKTAFLCAFQTSVGHSEIIFHRNCLVFYRNTSQLFGK